MQVTMALAVALFLLGTSHNANAQSLSVNPSAAASEVRNPSSINPAAAASDVRNPSAINPSARASQISGPSAISSTRPAGVAPTAPRQRAAPAPRHTPPEKSLGQASRDKRDSKSPPAAASAPVEPDGRSGEEARSRQDEQFQQWDAAAKRAIGSIVMGVAAKALLRSARRSHLRGLAKPVERRHPVLGLRPVKAIRGRSQHGPLVMPCKGGAACAALKVVGLPQREEKLIKDERHTIMRVAVGRIS
jgi:hypothetical protein